jgi:hypothetical protein
VISWGCEFAPDARPEPKVMSHRCVQRGESYFGMIAGPSEHMGGAKSQLAPGLPKRRVDPPRVGWLNPEQANAEVSGGSVAPSRVAGFVAEVEKHDASVRPGRRVATQGTT